MSLNFGIVICTRIESSRIHHKPIQRIQGKAIIGWLIDQLRLLNIPIFLACPLADGHYYHIFGDEVKFYYCDNEFEETSPLHRTLSVSKKFHLDYVIRITHDKIFPDIDGIFKACNQIKINSFVESLDYVYSSHLTEGTGFEIISKRSLERACSIFPNTAIEHISYAIKETNPKSYNFQHDLPYKKSSARLLIDFQEDLDFMRCLFSLINEAKLKPSLFSAIKVINENPWIKRINKLPEITVYTCVYNQKDYIEWSLKSIINQTIFSSIEYIIIDDASTDGTYKKIVNSKYFELGLLKLKRNEKNIGLSSSSNIAINMARGKYIIRMDADDSFLFPFVLEKMLKEIKKNEYDALYPSYVDDKSKTIQHGSIHHHAGGCLFLAKAIRDIQFREKLRGWEGYDLFIRAKNQLKVGYFEEMPSFFYRYSKKSLSNTDNETREKLLSNIKEEDNERKRIKREFEKESQ